MLSVRVRPALPIARGLKFGRGMKLFALVAKTIQIEHIVGQVNSRRYQLHQFEKIGVDHWLVVYFGLELIQIAKSDVLLEECIENRQLDN